MCNGINIGTGHMSVLTLIFTLKFTLPFKKVNFMNFSVDEQFEVCHTVQSSTLVRNAAFLSVVMVCPMLIAIIFCSFRHL